ncbi:MAG: transposase [Acholeplasmataceae bacterium]|nr:transposase [Acholeplasmataceae bacterium]
MEYYNLNKDLEYAYRLKEKHRESNLSAKFDTCESKLVDLINEFLNSRLEEFKVFGRLLFNWMKEIISSFSRIGVRRLSNGAIEGVNSRIKQS